jgi:hypothetical protein
MNGFVEDNLYKLHGSDDADIQLGNFRTYGPCGFRKMLLPLFASGEVPYFSFCGMAGQIESAVPIRDEDWLVVHTVALPEKQTEEEFVAFTQQRKLVRVISDPMGVSFDTHEEGSSRVMFAREAAYTTEPSYVFYDGEGDTELGIIDLAREPFSQGQYGDVYANVFLGADRHFLEDSLFELFLDQLVAVHGFTQEQVETLDKLDIAASGDLLNPGSGEFRLNLSFLRRITDDNLGVDAPFAEDSFIHFSEAVQRVMNTFTSFTPNINVVRENQNAGTGTEPNEGAGTDNKNGTGDNT